MCFFVIRAVKALVPNRVAVRDKVAKCTYSSDKFEICSTRQAQRLCLVAL
jgi:hypothetical protein